MKFIQSSVGRFYAEIHFIFKTQCQRGETKYIIIVVFFIFILFVFFSFNFYDFLCFHENDGEP